MRDERWVEVWEIFNSVYSKPQAQRSELLDRSSLDAEVRNEVLALLEVSMSCAGRPSALDPPAGPEYPVGHEFGRYGILGLIGQGGFGRIYAARDRELHRVVALKVLAGPLLDHGARLIDEARAASALNHPNIVTVYETISSDDHLAIVMEFVDGQSLRRLLQDAAAPLQAEKTLRYGRQMAEALNAAHQAGITHRDIKPENILVRKDDYVKLVDFGLATNVVAGPGANAIGPFAGTLRYVSPEQLLGDAASPASDVFSLGLVLYEMTTGTHAFGGGSPLQAAEAIATQQVVPPSRLVSTIPPELDRLIMAMLQKTPAARPTSAEVASTLEGIVGRFGPRGRRRVWISAAAAVALAATTGVWALVLSPWTRKPTPLTLRLDSRPLTGEEGRESSPAISPDGRFVVFNKYSTTGKPEVLLREIDTDRQTVLPIPGGRLSWLPDGERIAFVRRGKDTDTLSTIDRWGRGEQTVFQAANINYAEWSPDSAWIVYAAATDKARESHALFLYSTRTRESRQFTFPPDFINGDLYFEISPDGKQVAFRRDFGYAESDIFLVNLPDPGTPRRITSHHLRGQGLSWLSDGNAIFSCIVSGLNLSIWLEPLQRGQTPIRLTEPAINVTEVRSARQRNRLVWTTALDNTDIFRVPMTGGAQQRVVSSSMLDLDVAVSSLGLLAFRSGRSGRPEIWISREDGSSPKKVPTIDSRAGSPRWSPNGRRLAFDSRRGNEASDIYVTDCDPLEMQCGAPVRLTDHAATDAIPNWSPDGASIYFASQRSGKWQSWKVSMNGGTFRDPVQMTTQGGFFAAESRDGKWLYYTRIDSKEAMGVWRKPLSPFRAEDSGEMLLPLEFQATDTWLLTDRRILYSVFAGEAGVWSFDLETRRKRLIHATGKMPLARGLAISPDGRSIFFAQYDRWQSNVTVADYEIVR